jgi:hypothetical protein
VYSGFDGSVLHVFHGDAAGDHLGFSVAGAGDVDRDGLCDVILGAPGDDNNGIDCGSARVMSGATGLLLFSFDGDDAGDDFGNAVASAGEVNGDGHADLIVGAFGDANRGPDSGSARVFSGLDGSTITTFFNSNPGDRLGWAVSSGGITEPDGFASVVIGARGTDFNNRTDSGSVFVFDLNFAGTPPRSRVRGAGCVGSGGRLPRIGQVGAARFGDNVDVTLRGAAPNSTGNVLFIGSEVAIPLGLIGLAGCSLYVNPFANLAIPTDVNGMAVFDLPLANDPGTVGAAIGFQWVTPDAGAPYTLPLTLSDGLRMTIGL